MRRVLAYLLLAVPAQAGVIQGVVLEQISGRPVARTLVQLTPVPKPGGAAVKALTTRAGRSGQFVFSPVEPGLYIMTAVKEGFFTAAFGARLPAGKGAPIPVSADSDFFGELRLRHKGVIAGRVLDENGVGTVGVPVVAYRARLPLRSAGRGVSTDRGLYRISGLDPGKYWVRSGPHALEDGSGWLPTFGPQSREAREARVHRATVDGETTDADVSPEAGTLFALRGIVGCDTESLPVTVTLSSETGRRTTQVLCRGEYQFEGLAPGAYEVFAKVQGRESSGFVELFLDRESVSGTVQTMQAPTVNFTVREGGRGGLDLTGKVPVTIMGRRQDLAESEGERVFSGQRATVDAGHWEFRAKPPAGYYVERIEEQYGSMSFRGRTQIRAQDWFEVFIQPRFGTTVAVAISKRAGQLMGRVMAEDKPAPGVPVYLWPVAEAARRSLGGAPQLVTDTEGRFGFDSLPPGDYRVVASFDLHEIDEEIAEECRARTVRVEAAQQAILDLGVWVAP